MSVYILSNIGFIQYFKKKLLGHTVSFTFFFDVQTFKDVVSVDLAMASNLDSSVSKRRLNRGFAFVRFSSHAVSLLFFNLC